MVVKNNSTRELFSRTKLLAGVQRACEKTAVTGAQIERLVGKIEHELYACGEAEVSSKQIGKKVMTELARLNDVAYVRFASVYRRFKTIAGFEHELKTIKSRKTS
jgi:transcriptional repressor NrdR